MTTKTDNQSGFGAALTFSWTRSIPMILQAEASECGLACLAMVSHFHGKAISLRQLRLAVPAGSQGANLKQLIDIANQLELDSRPLKVDLDELHQLSFPAIIHWEFNHFVVLKRLTKKYADILDPAVGERRISWQQLSASYTGIALELTPAKSYQKLKAGKGLSLDHFIRSIVGLKRHLALLFALSLLIQVFALMSPFYMQTVIDNVLLSYSDSMLVVLALGFGLLLVIDTLCSFLRDTVMLRFSSMFNMHLSSSVMAHLLRLPLQYFQSRHMGDIVSRFGSLQPVRDILTQGLVSAFLDGILGIITLIVMFAYSWKLALIVCAVLLVYCILRWVLFFPVKRLNQQILQSDAKLQSYFMQSIRAARTIKLSGSEINTQNTWLQKFVVNSNQRIKLGQWNISFTTANKFLFGLENLIVVFVAATLVMDNMFSIGMLFAFVSYKSRFVDASMNLIENIIQYSLLKVHLARLEDIVFHPQELAHVTKHKTLPLPKAAQLALDKCESRQRNLVINQLSYRYEGISSPVFDNVELVVSKGDCIAITGASGCGKSTLLHCLLGLHEATSGNIVLNGKSLSPETRQQFNMAAVMQDDQLLNGSVLENITSFAEQVDLERLVWATQVACVEKDIAQMTMQYQTLIGDMGSSLSGGQKQRILLARAVYQQPELLVLDEATSHLDPATEAQVCKNLRALNTTIIMVAHRPQTIATADKVYVLSSQGLTATGHPNDVTSTSTK